MPAQYDTDGKCVGWCPEEQTIPRKAEFWAAYSRAQGKVLNARKNRENEHFEANYADLATVWNVVRGPFTEEGFSIVQLPCDAPAGMIGLLTIIGHSSGETLSQRAYCGVKDINNPQHAGSAYTYLKRYALQGVAGVAPEDDDGNAAAGRSGPAAAAVDYSATVAEALSQLDKASMEEARMLYNTVNTSVMPADVKNPLLRQMGAIIKARMGKETDK